MTKRTNEKLWEEVKREIYQSDKGGLKDTWTARKAQLAVQEYKKRGGEYIGKKDEKNPLVKWTKEDWDYINPNLKRGRYLPKKVREKLPKNLKISENLKKGERKGENIPYSEKLIEIMRRVKII